MNKICIYILIIFYITYTVEGLALPWPKKLEKSMFQLNGEKKYTLPTTSFAVPKATGKYVIQLPYFAEEIAVRASLTSNVKIKGDVMVGEQLNSNFGTFKHEVVHVLRGKDEQNISIFLTNLFDVTKYYKENRQASLNDPNLPVIDIVMDIYTETAKVREIEHQLAAFAKAGDAIKFEL